MSNTIEVGNIYLYYYEDEYAMSNKSLSLVEVLAEKNSTTSQVRFLQVFIDDSGNNLFKYLEENGETMIVSNCFLHPVNVINEQRKHINLLSERIMELENEEVVDNDISPVPFKPTPPDREFPVQIKLIESNNGKKTFNIQVGEYDYAYDAKNLKQAIEMFDGNIDDIDV